MPKTSRVGGASNGASPVAANLDQVVTVGHLAALLSQLGFPLTLTGTAGYGAPSEATGAGAIYAHWDGSNLTQNGAVIPTGGASTLTYDVIVAAGQSNMSGRATADTTRYETVHPHVYTYDTAGSYPNAITQAVVPLGHADRSAQTNGLGPDFGFARRYADAIAAPQGRRVLIVPVAYGGTGFASSAGTDSGVTLQWDPAGSTNLYTQAIHQANEAMAAAGSGARLVAFVWLQGEYDAAAALSGATYQAKLDALIAGVRAGVSGASSTTPFIVGAMVPEFITATGSAASAIAAVHLALPGRTAYTGYAAGTSGTQNGDNLHYNADGQRKMARSMWAAYLAAKANTLAATAPGVPGTPAATAGDGQVALAWTSPFANPAITNYLIEYRTLGATAWSTFSHAPSTSTTATITGLTDGTTYDFRVSAISSAGTGEASGVTSVAPFVELLNDTFTRTASSLGTADSGQTWTDPNTTRWSTDGTSAKVATATADFSPAYVDVGASDYTVTVTLGAVTTGQILGVCGRVQDGTNYYMAFWNQSVLSVQLWKVVSGSASQIGASITSQTFTAGDTLAASWAGTAITVKKNGTQIGSFTDSTYTTGTKAGLWTNPSAGPDTVQYVDAVVVTP